MTESDPGENRESIPLLLARTSHSAPTPVEATPPRPHASPALAGVRWRRTFVDTRPGAVALLFSALLVLLAVFADFFASDWAIMCKVHGTTFVLPNVTQPAELRGEKADWSIGPLVAHGPETTSPDRLARPFAIAGHPLGTDKEGRDVFARVVHGTRGYVAFAAICALAAILVGASLGGLGGIFGGPLDALVSRAVESVSAFPPLVLVIGIQAAVGRPTLLSLFGAIALTRWPEVARLVRGEVILASTRDYALAARALGASPLRVLWRHVTPNVRGPLVVAAAAAVSAVILTEASLDFLRVGATSAASWGETMSEFRDAPHAWWLLAFPGTLLVATVAALQVAGEAYRNAGDPREHVSFSFSAPPQ